MNAVGTAVFVRVLGVAEFGIYTLIISLMTLFIDFSEIGISSSIVRFGSKSIAEENRDRFKSIVAVLLRFKLVLGGAILTIAFLFSEAILRYTFYHVDERIAFFFQLSLLAIAANILAGIFIPIYQSFQKFQMHAILTTVRSALKFVLILTSVFFFSTFTISIGVWIEIVAALALVTLSYFYSPFKKFTLRTTDLTIQQDIFSFGKWMSLHTMIYIISTRVDIFFLGLYSNAFALGIYGAASKIAGLLLILTNSYWTVLLPEISAVHTARAIRQKQKKSFSLVFLFIAGIALVALLASPLIGILFGGKFETAVQVLQVMCIGVGCTVLCYPTNATLFALNKTVVFPIMSAISILSFTTANIYLIPIYGVLGAGIAYAINGGVAFLSSLFMYYLIGRAQLRRREEQEQFA